MKTPVKMSLLIGESTKYLGYLQLEYTCLKFPHEVEKDMVFNERGELYKYLDSGNDIDLLFTDSRSLHPDKFEKIQRYRVLEKIKAVAVICAPDDTYMISKLYEKGVDCIFTCDRFIPDDWVIALDKLIRGGKSYSSNVVEIMVKHISDNKQGIPESLLLKMIAEGKSDMSIAKTFGVSRKTVSRRIKELKEIYGVDRKRELAAFA